MKPLSPPAVASEVKLAVKAVQERMQTRGEEMANAITHGAGFVVALVAMRWLVASAAKHGDAAVVAGAWVFGGTTLLLYLASAVYHAMPHGGPAKRVFAVIDHSAIFLLIAGT